jgi:hypothetical protein
MHYLAEETGHAHFGRAFAHVHGFPATCCCENQPGNGARSEPALKSTVRSLPSTRCARPCSHERGSSERERGSCEKGRPQRCARTGVRQCSNAAVRAVLLTLAFACGNEAKNDASIRPPLTPATSNTAETCELALPRLSETHIAVAGGHACAWRDQGGVWCWGSNATGDLGDGTREDRPTPVLVSGLRDVLQVQAAGNPDVGFSCALRSDGSVACWGENREGQLGDGTRTSCETPCPVPGLSDVAEIASSGLHSCARLHSGEVRCWGMGRDGALGDGQLFSGLTPVVAINLSDATQLAVGFTFSCALKRDASVMCWGSNIYGEVGNNSELSALVPTQVLGLPPVTRIGAAPFQVCAQTNDGRIFCWGNNEFGSLGIGSRTKAVRTPVQVHGVPCGATLMPRASCAVTSDGSAYCWGIESGDGSDVKHEEGAALVPIERVVSVVGFRSFFVVTVDENVWAWGHNDYGQLGDGTRERRLVPVQIAIPR